MGRIKQYWQIGHKRYAGISVRGDDVNDGAFMQIAKMFAGRQQARALFIFLDIVTISVDGVRQLILYRFEEPMVVKKLFAGVRYSLSSRGVATSE